MYHCSTTLTSSAMFTFSPLTSITACKEGCKRGQQWQNWEWLHESKCKCPNPETVPVNCQCPCILHKTRNIHTLKPNKCLLQTMRVESSSSHISDMYLHVKRIVTSSEAKNDNMMVGCTRCTRFIKINLFQKNSMRFRNANQTYNFDPLSPRK